MTLRLAAVLVLFTPSLSARSSEPGPPARLDPERFKALAAEKQGLLLDVRTAGEVARGHLAGTSVIDSVDPKFTQKLKRLPRGRPIFVYCASGGRSAVAARALGELGFPEVYDLAGGMRAWTAAGLPVERTGTASPAAGVGGLQPETLEPAAFDALLTTRKRVLVDFQAPWCAPCQKMAPVVDALAKDHHRTLTVLKVDVDQSEALAARERVEGLPVLVLYVDGQERRRVSGEQTRATLEQLLAP
jgi:thioredoxin